MSTEVTTAMNRRSTGLALLVTLIAIALTIALMSASAAQAMYCSQPVPHGAYVCTAP
jgi:uncharacterized protein YfaQ (DUF2300 family)